MRVLGDGLERVEPRGRLVPRHLDLALDPFEHLECAHLGVKDLDFERLEIVVRDGKGRRDRQTMLPEGMVEPLRTHLAKVRAQHGADVAAGAGWVELPDALDRK